MADPADKHVHFHSYVIVPEPESVTRKLDDILTQFSDLESRWSSLMATVADVQAKMAALQVSVNAETNLSQSIISFLQGQATEIGSLKSQLAAAIAAGGDNAAVLQSIVDGLGVIQDTNDANAKSISDAMLANTPAADLAEPPL